MKISLKELNLKIIEILLQYTNDIQDKFEDIDILNNPKIDIYTETVNKSIASMVKRFHIHESYNIHLTSVIQYKNKNKCKAVFVTTDYGILDKKFKLEKYFKIGCSNPLYALQILL